MRLRCVAGRCLALLLLCDIAAAQATWTALDLGWFRDQACSVPLALDPYNVPKTVGTEKVWIRWIPKSPATPCTDALGHAIDHDAEYYPTFAEAGKPPFGSWDGPDYHVGAMPCNTVSPWY